LHSVPKKKPWLFKNQSSGARESEIHKKNWARQLNRSAIQRETKPDTFFAIINSIISQQISRRAADTVVEHLEKILGQIAPMLSP